MFRVSYTDRADGTRHAVELMPAYAELAYHVWCRLPQAADVVLEQYSAGAWRVVAAHTEKVRVA